MQSPPAREHPLSLRRPAEARRRPAPFTQLARTHALTIAGDTLVATALAGSLFFSISPDAARGRVALYLLLTMAPFALVAPLIGPAIDRRKGGRRLMVVISAVVRAGVCVLMIDDIDGLLLFPEAFTVLVMGKGYTVAKSALVPTLVPRPDQLLEANSKLTLVGGVTGLLVAGPGVALLQLGPGWVLALAATCFAGAAALGWRLPGTAVAQAPADATERAELRSSGILLAASAMAVLRAIVGLFTFLVAFELRRQGAPAWWFGLALAGGAAGSLAGAGLAPLLRRHVREERILVVALVMVAVTGLVMAQLGDRWTVVALSAVIMLGAAGGKLAFDALVQRDAPDANQGRSFARFETRFQLVWVVGAFIPVLLPVPLAAGYLLIAGLAAFAAFTYVTGRSSARRHPHRPPLPSPVARVAARVTSGAASRLNGWPAASRWRRGGDDQSGGAG